MKDIGLFILGWLIGYALGNAAIWASGVAWRSIRRVRK